MNLSRHEVIHWFTTPEELRSIADEMEKRWRRLQPGQDKTITTVYGKTTELKILVDQENIKSPGWLDSD